jgi:ferredoxin
MVIAEIKPFEEIKNLLKKYKKILVAGCGSCVTVCLSGGKKQVELLASALRTARKIEGDDVVVGEKVIPRQCEPKFVDMIKDEAGKYEVILSMGCGAGVQGIAERIINIPVLPALNTTFIGLADEKGQYLEVCAACGDCILSKTGGICPVARCAKSLINGPCGGSRGGMCEVSKDNPCVWQLIYDRLVKLDMLYLLKGISQPKTRSVHPRRMVREDLTSEKELKKGV